MRKSSWVLIALAISTSTALAQPGATPPTEPPPPPPDGAPPGDVPPAQVQAGAGAELDIDGIAAKVHAEAPTIETVARGAFRRARRAISFGPTIGGWGGTLLGDPGVDTGVHAGLTFGLGVEWFKVPVLPDPATIKALIIERVKAQAKDRIKAAFTGRYVEPLEAEQIVKQIYEEVRAEILGLENVRPKTFERPRISVALEANRLFDSGRWLGRFRVGIGVWKLTFAMSSSVGCVNPDTCNNNVNLFIGPELALHALTSKNPRASVVDVFVRWDFQATRRDSDAEDARHIDMVVLGARFLLDLI